MSGCSKPADGGVSWRRLVLFRGRLHYLFRALACLRPYWLLIGGAYAAMLCGNAVTIMMPLVIRRIIDEGIGAGALSQITLGCAALLALALVSGLCHYATGVWTEIASQNVAFDLRNRFHRKLQSLSFSFHDDAETGQLLTRSISDVDRLRFLTGRAVLHLVQMLTLVAGVSAAMLLLDLRLACLTLSIMPVVIGCAFVLGSRLRPLAMKVRDREAVLTAYLEQRLRGSRIVRAYGREAAEIRRFAGHNGRLLALQWREAWIRAVYVPMMQIVLSVGTLVVLLVGGSQVIRGELTLGVLVAFMVYVTQLVEPGRRFGWIVASIAQASASAERIFEILDLDAEISDKPGAVTLQGVSGHICFEHVTFAYSRTDTILDDISFEVLPGERVALLGGTGSGKSSIVSLIPRFYDATSGRVTVDGIDVRDIAIKSLRDHLGMVFQDTILFAATIRENIAFGRPDASLEEIESAARAAHADDFISALPRGYDSRIGEQGASLSGGQKQRLAIARALLKNPAILLLDDATSSVDTETEEKIQAALDTLMRKRTSIVIAQRLSTILQADRILLLDRGRIVAGASRQGTLTPHQQLLQTCGLYVDIVATQLRSTPAAANQEPPPAAPCPGVTKETP